MEEELVKNSDKLNSDFIEIPIFIYLGEHDSLRKRKKYYKFWSCEIEKGNLIDIGDNLGYILTYLCSVIIDFIENHDINYLLNRFELIMKGYGEFPIVKKYLISWKSDVYLLTGDYKNSLKVKKEIGFEIYDLLSYGTFKIDSLINGGLLADLRRNGLTDYGKKNKKDIIEIIDVHLDIRTEQYGKNIVRHFLEDFKIKNLTRDDLKSLEKYFIYKEEFNNLKKLHENNKRNLHESLNSDLENLKNEDVKLLRQNLNDKLNFDRLLITLSEILRIYNFNNIPHIIFRALENELKRIIRESENFYRKKKGIYPVGEKWVSETELYYKVKESFKNETVILHGMPRWLRRQHLDIYFPEKKIAIEYQGVQHKEPVEFFDGNDGFKKRLKLDETKKRICNEHNCKLIHVYPGYDFEELEKTIKFYINETSPNMNEKISQLSIMDKNRICKNCNNENPHYAYFCGHCGNTLFK